MAKGIMFTEAIFNAVIEGRKTQTRRIVKPQPHDFYIPNKLSIPRETSIDGAQGKSSRKFKPRYKLGEKVFIKEPYQYVGSPDAGIKYKYDNDSEINFIVGDLWKNKLFMPAKYARYFIEITGVRCERLQDISDEDCLSEGIVKTIDMVLRFDDIFNTPQQAYAALINKINGKGTWESNPYVWVYSFRLVK